MLSVFNLHLNGVKAMYRAFRIGWTGIYCGATFSYTLVKYQLLCVCSVQFIRETHKNNSLNICSKRALVFISKVRLYSRDSQLFQACGPTNKQTEDPWPTDW